jgi:hypothetical protein
MKKLRKMLIPALHILAWALFIYLATPRFETPQGNLFSPFNLLMPISYLYLIGYFYFNFYTLVPCFLSKKKIARYLLISIGAYLLFCFLLPLLFHPYLPQRAPMRFLGLPDAAPNPLRLLAASLHSRSSQFLIIFIISTGWKAGAQWYAEKQRLHELENAMIQAELSFLKSQIHPHFLFNSLNSIYYLALTHDPKAPQAILSLSNFLRFVTTESNHNHIPLQKEIQILQEYIHLQNLRTTEKFELQLQLPPPLQDRLIMPLTFIPFVENAFKHGISSHINCFIHIKIEIDGDALLFTCTNSIVPHITPKNLSAGVGLENIRKRLALAYPERHTLSLKADSQSFHTQLLIQL